MWRLVLLLTSGLFLALLLAPSRIPVYMGSVFDGVQRITSNLKRLDDNVDQESSNYYLGYRSEDSLTSWAKYWNATAPTLSPQLTSALLVRLSIPSVEVLCPPVSYKAQQDSPLPAGTGHNVRQAAKAMAQPGYLQLENGFSVNEDGSMTVAVLTDLPPNFTGQQ